MAKVRLAQVWRDKDPRMRGREVLVLGLEPAKSQAIVATRLPCVVADVPRYGPRTRISEVGLNKRFTLVRDPEAAFFVEPATDGSARVYRRQKPMWPGDQPRPAMVADFNRDRDKTAYTLAREYAEWRNDNE